MDGGGVKKGTGAGSLKGTLDACTFLLDPLFPSHIHTHKQASMDRIEDKTNYTSLLLMEDISLEAYRTRKKVKKRGIF